MYVGGHASANSVFAIVIDPSKMPGTQGLGGFTDVSGSLSLSLSLHSWIDQWVLDRPL